MKLHLPVKMFRSLLALLTAFPVASYAAYTKPTEIVIPDGYEKVLVEDTSDLLPYVSDKSDIAFCLINDLIFVNWGKVFICTTTGSRYFTSASTSYLSAFQVSGTSGRRFLVDEGAELGFSSLDSVYFSDNRGASCQGVIYGSEESSISFVGNKSISFVDNLNGAVGGNYQCSITFCNNGNMEFLRNNFIGSSSGGAISVQGNSSILIDNNGDIEFCGNSSSDSYGGAVSCSMMSSITITNNGDVSFIGNMLYTHCTITCGGALAGVGNNTIKLNNNKSVLFSDNSIPDESDNDSSHGGALCVNVYKGGSVLELNNNGSVGFCNNFVKDEYVAGGAISVWSCNTSINNNGKVYFRNNAIHGTGENAAYGGAIFGTGDSLELRNNGAVEFSGNLADSSADAVYGGAVYADTLKLRGNGAVAFSGNLADSSADVVYGGAVYATSTHLSGNESIQFTGNMASSDAESAYGGAISGRYGYSLEVNDNGNVSFVGNKVIANSSAHGGAIYVFGMNTGALSLCNNESVLFEKNAQIDKDSYLLRSIYVNGSVSNLSLSAAEGNKIEFRDSVKLNAYQTIKLNADYTDAEGVVHKQQGDIIFTGKYTEAHLNELLNAHKAGRVATGDELTNSRTSELSSAILYGGTLRVEHNAILDILSLQVKSGHGATVSLENATLDASTVSFEQGTSLRIKDSAVVRGTLEFQEASSLDFEFSPSSSATLTIQEGGITLSGKVDIRIQDNGKLTDKQTYTLISGIRKPYNWDSNTSVLLPVSASDASRLYWSESSLLLYYDQLTSSWTNLSGNRRWDLNSVNWRDEGENIRYQDASAVIFNNTGAGAITLVGTLKPYSVTVNNGSGYDYTWQGSGKLSGSMKLTKKGAGALTIKTSNTYTGGTAISGGTVVLGANNALGSGAITLSNATLNMGGKITPNNLTLTGSSKILSGTNYRGNFTMNGNLLAGSSINIISGKTANLKKGNVGGTISGAGNTVINGAVTLNGGKITTNKLTISGSGKKLTANASGLVMNKNASDIGLSNGGNLTSAGAITARNITLSNKAVLNAKNSAVRHITLGGKLQGTDSTVNMFGNLTAGNLVLTRSTLTNNGSSVRNLSLSGALTLSSATLNHYGNISAKNVTATASGIRQTGASTGMKLSGNLSLGSKSTLNLFGALNAANVTLSGNSVLNNANSTVRNAVVKGKLQATNSTVSLHGNLTAGNVVLNNATLRDNGSSARAVTVTNSTSLSNNAKLNIKGYLRSKNLTLNKSSLRQHSNNRGVGLTGTLTMNSGSTLTAQGALSAANMKLSGGTINLTSSSFSTIKVSGTLTLSSAIDLNLGCKLTTGKNYTLIRFNKTNLSSRNNLAKLLGLTGSGATLTLRSTGIILKVTNAAAWNKYLSANKTAFNKAASVVNAIAPAAEESEVVEIAADTATTVASEPAYDRSSADMLVQSNWGVVNASRAFTDTLGNRAFNSTTFGADKSSAVWLSAMGASSRLSSDGAAAGSDYNLYGAAVGMEQQLTEKSSLGLAIGESYGRVNSFTSARTKQDTLHTALYGQYSAVERSRDAVLLDWSAAYGRTESKWQGTEWEQKSVQLDARATWAHLLTADTTVSGFAGMQYFASESADIAPGIKSGSVQNLRGEIGVGIGHMATVKTRVYGELRFVGDMVRHNPTADMGGVRERGANPGRAGINFSVGGTHALNDRWSVNAGYNLELMERANSHRANIGTSYRF